MAQEEIKLVGSFDDKITKKLQSLNREINNIGRSFERFNKKLSPVTKSMAKMAMSAKEFSNAMKSQRNSIDSSARSMREYSKQAGKMSNAMRKVTDARMKAQREMGLSRAQARKNQAASGGAITPGLPTIPKAPTYSPKSRGGGKAAKDVGAVAGQSFMKNVASTAIGVGIANAFMGGVSKVKNMFLAPFRKFGDAFKERIGDEMDDLKSAGGMYALDMDLTSASGNSRLFQDFNESLQFQERINTAMAASASNLPGTTSEFVNVNRQMTDTLQMILENDRDKFVELGTSMGANTAEGGQEAILNSFERVGQKLTEGMMLASSGQQGGLPMHIAVQQILGKEQGKFKAQAFTNKFRAAFQKNPLLKNFLMRAEKDINATGANTAERLAVVESIFARATPEDQITKMRGSLAGLMESVRSGLLDPQGGLFGLSRAVSEFDKEGNVIGKLMKKDVNLMGETMYKVTEPFKDKNGKVLTIAGKDLEKGMKLTAAQIEELGEKMGDLAPIVNKATGEIIQGGKKVGEVSKSTTYLFEQLRNIGANYGAVFTQFVGLLPTLFDPFSKMTSALIPLSEKSAELFRVFRMANQKLDARVEEMRNSSDKTIKGMGANLQSQVMQRSALFSLADFLASTGAIDTKEMQRIKEKVVGKGSFSKDAIDGFSETAAEVFKDMFDALMGSEFIKEVGKIGGILIGGIMRTTFDVINGIFNALANKSTGSQIVDGFIEGFETQFSDIAGGFSGFMQMVNDLLAKVIDFAADLLVTKVIPALMKSLMQLILGGFKSGPFGAFLSGAAVIGLTKALIKAVTSVMAMAAAAQKAAFRLNSLGKGFIPGRAKGNSDLDLFNQGRDARKNLVKNFSKKGILSNAKAGLKTGGLAALAFGAIDAGTKIAAGEDAGHAVGEAASGVIGGTLGGILGQVLIPVPGLGAMIGSTVGGMLGNKLFNQFNTPAQTMLEAAKIQQDSVKKDTGIEIAGGVARDLARISSIDEVIKKAGAGAAGEAYSTALKDLSSSQETQKQAAADLNAFITARKEEGRDAGEISQLSEYKKLQDNFNKTQEQTTEHAKAVNKLYADLPEAVRDAIAEGAKKDPSPSTGTPSSGNRQRNRRGGGANSPEARAAQAGMWSKITNFSQGKNLDGTEREASKRRKTGGFGNVKVGENSAATRGGGVATPVVAAAATIPTEAATAALAPVTQAASAAGEPLNTLSTGATAAAPPLTDLAPKITAANTELETIPASSKEVCASLDAANSALLGFVGELAPIPEQVAALLTGAATTAGTAITAAAQGLATALSSAANSIKNAASASASASMSGGIGGKPNYKGSDAYSRTLPLNQAIQAEMKNKPPGSDLVIANSSETIIPAFDGHVGDGFKGLSFAELESAAGFDRMKTYTEQIAEVADKTAAEFMGGMGGALGGGSATLNAMEALGNSMGLITTSGFRPGDPGFHGANRARDLSNGGGETPEMNKVANIMATKYGQSLTELIYTPLGYSIKNGAKTGLISPANHYHHIHVAVAEGLAKAAVFNSQKAAEAYERSMMPAGSEPMKVNLASMTANSSEFGGGGVTVGDINVSVSGVDDPKAIANQVAEQLMLAIQEATHKEIFSS